MSDLTTCRWDQKWEGFNSWKVECREAGEMYGARQAVAVPPAGARYCCWCGREMKFVLAKKKQCPEVNSATSREQGLNQTATER